MKFGIHFYNSKFNIPLLRPYFYLQDLSCVS
jgi:hypothetical protein